jgi:hypothetical protein
MVASEGSSQWYPAWNASGLALLDHRIEAHVVIVVHRLVAGAGDAIADDAGYPVELGDRALGFLGGVERQVDQRFDAVVRRQDAVRQPAVIGAAEPHLHFRLRMHAEEQHRGRKYHHVVDGERIHRAPRQHDIAMDAAFRDRFALPVLVRDAGADALVAQAEIAVEAVGRGIDALGLEMDRLLAHDGIFDVADDLLPRHGLDVMGIDVADEPVAVFALDRILPRMGEDVARVGEDVDLLWRDQLGNGGGGCVHRLTSGLVGPASVP